MVHLWVRSGKRTRTVRPMSAPTFKLISLDVCPFVQRSAITLAHKGVAFETVYIDTSAKPEWFLAISPLGKVPVLVVTQDGEDTVLFESAVINEYLDEVTGGGMLPSDPLRKARHRAMIELGSAALGDAWRLGIANDEAAAQKSAAALRDKLGRFETALVGPMFTGAELKLVDTSVIPLLQRALWTEQLVPSLDLFVGLPKVRAWLEAAEALEAVTGSILPEVPAAYKQIFVDRGSWVGRGGETRAS